MDERTVLPSQKIEKWKKHVPRERTAVFISGTRFICYPSNKAENRLKHMYWWILRLSQEWCQEAYLFVSLCPFSQVSKTWWFQQKTAFSTWSFCCCFPVKTDICICFEGGPLGCIVDKGPFYTPGQNNAARQFWSVLDLVQEDKAANLSSSKSGPFLFIHTKNSIFSLSRHFISVLLPLQAQSHQRQRSWVTFPCGLCFSRFLWSTNLSEVFLSENCLHKEYMWTAIFKRNKLISFFCWFTNHLVFFLQFFHQTTRKSRLDHRWKSSSLRFPYLISTNCSGRAGEMFTVAAQLGFLPVSLWEHTNQSHFFSIDQWILSMA